MSPRARNTLVFLAGAVLTSVFFINLCATLYRCGCRSLWTQAAAHCNVRQTVLPQCPWCRYGEAASSVPWLLILAAQAAVSFSPRAMPVVVRLLATAAAFPVSGTILGVIYGIATGYWK